jgi:hypothetical protein
MIVLDMIVHLDEPIKISLTPSERTSTRLPFPHLQAQPEQAGQLQLDVSVVEAHLVYLRVEMRQMGFHHLGLRDLVAERDRAVVGVWQESHLKREPGEEVVQEDA